MGVAVLKPSSVEAARFLESARARGESALICEIEPGKQVALSGSPEDIALIEAVVADYRLARQIADGVGEMIAQRMLRALGQGQINALAPSHRATEARENR